MEIGYSTFYIFCLGNGSGYYHAYCDTDIGTTVFLTREAAEAALSSQKGGQ